MLKNKKLAAVLLAGVVLVLGHSLLCLMQGKFQEAMIMAPVLVIVYIFGTARRERPETELQDQEDPQPHSLEAKQKDHE